MNTLIDKPELFQASKYRLEVHARYNLALSDLKMAQQCIAKSTSTDVEDAAVALAASQVISELKSRVRYLHLLMYSLFEQEVLGIYHPDC